AADAAADYPAGAARIDGIAARQPRVQVLGTDAVLCAGLRRRHLWLAGGLLDRPVGPSPGAHVEHLALRVFSIRSRLRDVHPNAPGIALHDVHWSMRRIRRCGRLVGRAVRRSTSTRTRAGVHPSVLVGGWIAGCGSFWNRSQIRGFTADDRATRMARRNARRL